jgi:hypothetical protein
MKPIRQLFLGLALASGALLSQQIEAAESNGIIALSYEASNTLIIVDTNSKKILVYNTSDRNGLSLKEVRSFESALQLPSFFHSKGISVSDEKKEFAKLKVEN